MWGWLVGLFALPKIPDTPNLRVTIVAHSVPGMSSPASVTDPHPHGEAQGMDGLRKGAHQGRLPQTGWVWEAFFLEGRCGPMQATV